MAPAVLGPSMGQTSAVGFGLATAAGAGTADFLAKTTTDRVGALSSVWFLEAFGAPILVVLALAIDGLPGLPVQPMIELAGLSSLSILGLFCLYRAFEFGRLSVVAPLTSGYPAMVVVLSGAYLGESFGALQILGLAATLGGIVTLSSRENPRGRSERPATAGVPYALAAFVAFGLFYFGLKFLLGPIPPTTGAAEIRLVGLALVAPVIWFRGARMTPPAGLHARALAFPALDSLSLVVFNLGVVYAGSLSVLTTVSGLYGAITLAWATVVLRERPDAVQWAACGLVFLGVILLAVA